MQCSPASPEHARCRRRPHRRAPWAWIPKSGATFLITDWPKPTFSRNQDFQPMGTLYWSPRNLERSAVVAAQHGSRRWTATKCRTSCPLKGGSRPGRPSTWRARPMARRPTPCTCAATRSRSRPPTSAASCRSRPPGSMIERYARELPPRYMVASSLNAKGCSSSSVDAGVRMHAWLPPHFALERRAAAAESALHQLPRAVHGLRGVRCDQQHASAVHHDHGTGTRRRRNPAIILWWLVSALIYSPSRSAKIRSLRHGLAPGA